MTKCEKCGVSLSAAVAAGGICPSCGAAIVVSASSGTPGDSPLTTGGHVESFGAYGSAADEMWIDPTQARGLDRAAEMHIPLPPDIQAKRDAFQRRRQIQTFVLGGVGLLFLIALVALYLYVPGPTTP